MVVAVTGSRGFRAGEQEQAGAIIRERLQRLRGVTEFRTGAQWGVDTVAAQAGLLLYPSAHHVVFVPAAPHNAAVVAEVENAPGAGLVEKVTVIAVGGKSDADSYKQRNLMMVRGAELVVAFPSTGLEQVRSGTWMTVRIARRLDVPLMIVPLDGSRSWVESGKAGEQRVGA